MHICLQSCGQGGPAGWYCLIWRLTEIDRLHNTHLLQLRGEGGGDGGDGGDGGRSGRQGRAGLIGQAWALYEEYYILLGSKY